MELRLRDAELELRGVVVPRIRRSEVEVRGLTLRLPVELRGRIVGVLREEDPERAERVELEGRRGVTEREDRVGDG